MNIRSLGQWLKFALLALTVLSSIPSTAQEQSRLCEDSFLSAHAIFRPNYQLALTRSNYATNLPENTLGVDYSPTSNFRDRIKHLGQNLDDPSPSAEGVARSNLLYLLRFGQSVDC